MTTILADVPETFELEQNYPNPFNPTTKIRFALPEEDHVTLRVYDFLGRQVITLVDQPLQAGVHEVTWDGRDTAGAPVSSGVYLYRIEAGRYSGTYSMTLLK